MMATIGISVNVHYCNGEVKFVDIIADFGNCCCGDEEDSDNCCDDETFFYQLNDEQNVRQNIRILSVQPVSCIAETYCVLEYSNWANEEINYEQLDLPPPDKRSIWLLNCSLTYYG